jgi:hypothetical protein
VNSHRVEKRFHRAGEPLCRRKKLLRRMQSASQAARLFIAAIYPLSETKTFGERQDTTKTVRVS